MTRQEAIVKVRKIVAQANGTPNPNEREAAIRQAKRLMAKFNITAIEVDSQSYLAAYEDISKLVIDFTNQNPIIDVGFFGGFNFLGEVIAKTKDQLSPEQKANIVKKLKNSNNRQIALVVLGSRYEPLMTQIEVILRNHNL
jgi:hypothetical protein